METDKLKNSLKEWTALAVTLAGLIGIPFWVLAYNNSFDPPGRRVIHLTGIMKNGVWTTDRVNSLNYGVKEFESAEIMLQKGEQVLIRLRSADVTHGFYIPELGIGPFEVEPGHVAEIQLDADTVGVFTYYCTTVCGDCHHFMRGLIRIGEPDVSEAVTMLPKDEFCQHEYTPPPDPSSLIHQGRILFQRKGCIACHGESGKGGIRNPNYIKETVPNLNLLAERIFLYEPEDAESIINLIEQDIDPASLEDAPLFRSYNRFIAKYISVRDVIRNGNPAGRLDSTGVFPPLNMPSWEAILSDREIDALIVYLLNEYPWDEESY
jgi:mono/diheme cytochrome c family protein